MSSSISNTTITSASGGGGNRGGANGDVSAQRGDQSGRGRGPRSRNRNRVRSDNPNDSAAATRPARAGVFKGATEGMNGNTFGCYHEQTDKRQYTKTVEALDQYATKTYKYPEDFASLFLAEPSAPTIDKPAAPP